MPLCDWQKRIQISFLSPCRNIVQVWSKCFPLSICLSFGNLSAKGILYGVLIVPKQKQFSMQIFLHNRDGRKQIGLCRRARNTSDRRSCKIFWTQKVWPSGALRSVLWKLVQVVCFQKFWFQHSSTSKGHRTHLTVWIAFIIITCRSSTSPLLPNIQRRSGLRHDYMDLRTHGTDVSAGMARWRRYERCISSDDWDLARYGSLAWKKTLYESQVLANCSLRHGMHFHPQTMMANIVVIQFQNIDWL